MAKVHLEEGQIVYVTETGFYESKPNLTEYRVTRVNGSSFYAYRADLESKHESRFDRKTMICKTGYGYTKTAFLTAQEYWDLVALRNEAKELRANIQEAVKIMDLKTLRKINELIETSA
ncbi:hypothetical protein CVD28_03450 [Bacillus sp. M6-12]|uniref:beta barrel domain-containing protein n=1 Tax=Bacillus sp. M6-12 TaxID=2054166 RepID=UPI000C793E43|nr:hypothetical protein [Bacillus sp. M6-12]PLS19485.1 hypothetical protein CVD28_03450 [Bacillus sp. M6-12]